MYSIATGLILLAVLIGGAILYGRKSQKVDTIQQHNKQKSDAINHKRQASNEIDHMPDTDRDRLL